MIKFLEGIRIALIFVGFFLAYYFQANAIFYLLILVALPIHFICFIESFFYGASSAKLKGRSYDRAYQLQCAYFWLTMSIMITASLIMPLDKPIQLMLYYITLLFFFLSSIGHLIESFKHNKKSVKLHHQMRFYMTIILIIASIPLLLK